MNKLITNLIYVHQSSASDDDIDYTDSPIDFIIKHHPETICKTCNRPLEYPIFCNQCEYYTCKSCLRGEKCCNIIQTNNRSGINGRGVIAESLGRLRVVCPINNIYGCHWNGPRSQLIKHCDSCTLDYTNCTFGCDKKVFTSKILDHLHECKSFNNSDDIDSQVLTRKYFINEIQNLRNISTSNNKKISNCEKSYSILTRRFMDLNNSHIKLQSDFTNLQSKYDDLASKLESYISDNLQRVIVQNQPTYQSFIDFYTVNRKIVKNRFQVEFDTKAKANSSFNRNSVINIDFEFDIAKIVLPDQNGNWLILCSIDPDLYKLKPRLLHNTNTIYYPSCQSVIGDKKTTGTYGDGALYATGNRSDVSIYNFDNFLAINSVHTISHYHYVHTGDDISSRTFRIEIKYTIPSDIGAVIVRHKLSESTDSQFADKYKIDFGNTRIMAVKLS